MKQKMYLKAEAIYKYLTGNDALHTLIATRGDHVELTTTDQSLYEALGSVEKRNEVDINLLVKLLEVVSISPFDQVVKNGKRKILTQERVNEVRKQ